MASSSADGAASPLGWLWTFCGRARYVPDPGCEAAGAGVPTPAGHIIHRDASHARSAGSLRHTGVRDNPTENSAGASQARTAASFERTVISA